MLSRIRNRQKGFTLIELLIVIAIIGIIAALLIPNFLDALQKAKQKRTVADIKNTGTALFMWLTDVNSAAAAGQDVTTVDYSCCDATTVDDLEKLLIPRYTQSVPEKDGWKNLYKYGLNDPTNPDRVILIASAGQKGEWEGGPFTVGGFDPTDYPRDIIWSDGYFVQYPQNLGQDAGGAP
jgi:type II secretion system protein G